MSLISVLSVVICLLAFDASFSQRMKSDLFERDDVLELTLRGKINDLLNDRTNDADYHPMLITYTDGGDTISIPIKVKTRGHFRLKKQHCTFPPLLLNFSKANTPKGSVFGGHDKVKLVMPCQGDKYVVREYLAYKLHNVVTSKSLRARLVRVTLEHEKNGKQMKTQYGILLEETEQMAKRNEMTPVKGKMVLPQNTETYDFLKMTVFEYLIGNTDWSVPYMQNVKLIAPDSLTRPVPVPYDFDHAGIVGAPYAKPAEELLLNNIQTRRYRGYCMGDMQQFDQVFAHFNAIKEDLYNVYQESPLIEPEYRKWVTKYLDDFYKTINDPVKAKDQFTYPCRQSGTAHVVIKGLK